MSVAHIVATLILGLVSSVSYADATDHSASDDETKGICSDLLEEIGHKPFSLEFLYCRTGKVHGLDAHIAKYRVKGENAKAIERYFGKTAKMPSLAFICCGGETPGQHAKLIHNEQTYQISMATAEIPLNQRTDWRQIPWFYVVVTHYLESP